MTQHIPVGYTQIGALLNNDDNPHVSEITFGVNYPDSPVDVDQLFSSVTEFLGDVLQDCTTNIHCSQLIFTQGQASGPPLSGMYPIETIDGAASGDPMTPNVSYCYTKSTASLGRKNKGRFYLPGVSESHVDGGGNVASSFLSDQRNHCASAMTALSSATATPALQMVVFHTDPSLTPTPVTALIPQGMVATQRRRLKR